MPKIAYQLYCSRNGASLDDTCRMLGDAHYTYVEGYGGLFDDLSGLQRALNLGGVQMTSSHMGFDLVEDDLDRALKIAKTLSIKSIYVPFIQPADRPSDDEGWRAFGKRLEKIGQPFRDAGIVFGWHNHDFEMQHTGSGAIPLDLIAEADISLELDIGWVARAGHDPVETINKHADKITAAHIKDIAPVGECTDEDGWADVGHGTLDWTAIHAALKAAEVALYVAEHDNPSDDARFAKRSLASITTF